MKSLRRSIKSKRKTKKNSKQSKGGTAVWKYYYKPMHK